LFYVLLKNKKNTYGKVLKRDVSDVSYFDKYLMKKISSFVILPMAADKLLLDIEEDKISISK
jgi:hypothetical protein